MTVTFRHTGLTIDDFGVTTLNSLGGDINLTSVGGSIIITPSGSTINLEAIGGGSGSVTSVSVSGKNGIQITGSPITSAGTIDIGLGAITPSSINTGIVSASTLNLTGDIQAATGRITVSAATITGKLSGVAAAFSGLVSADAGINTSNISAASISITGDFNSGGRVTVSAMTVNNLFTGNTASFSGIVSANAGLKSTTGAFSGAVDFFGANTHATGSYTLNDNISINFGAIGQFYSDATNTILNPISGIISIGPTGSTTSASGGAQISATGNFLVSRIGLGSPINNFYWCNYDLTTTQGRGALNFTQNYNGAGGIQVGINTSCTYSGSNASPLNISLWSQAFLNVDNSGTSTTGTRTSAGFTSGLVISQGTHNIANLFILDGGVGGTSTGGTINRWGIQQAAFGAYVGTATTTTWGAFFGNDLAVGSDVKRYVEGSSTVKGDSYNVFNSATTDWDFFVDAQKVLTLDNDAIDASVPFRPMVGTTALAPIVMTAGTSLTTPLAGAIEFDGSYFYMTV